MFSVYVPALGGGVVVGTGVSLLAVGPETTSLGHATPSPHWYLSLGEENLINPFITTTTELGVSVKR